MRTIKFPIWFLSLFGLLFLGISGGWFLNVSRFVSVAVPVEGEVVDFDVDSVYRPVFAYEYPPGQTRMVHSSSGSNPPSYKVGEKVEVLVNPSNPTDGRLDSFAELWIGPIIFGSFGLLALSIGIGLLIWSVRRKKMEEYLLRNGEKIEAKITEVSLNRSIRVNGENPWRVTAQAEHGGQVHVFKSANAWIDPSPYLGKGTVDVYWTPHRPKDYWVDLRFLPPRAKN